MPKRPAFDVLTRPKKSALQDKADKYFADQEKRLGKLPKKRGRPKKAKAPIT